MAMNKVKVNIMSIVAFFTLLFGIIALGCFEGEMTPSTRSTITRTPYLDFFVAAVIISFIFAFFALIITCLNKPEILVGKLYLFFGVCAFMLLLGIILVIVYHGRNEKDSPLLIAAYCFAGFQLIACLVGTVAPCAMMINEA